ncbi:MAG: alcohol dehydrogenase catalytic domain-containing protein [Clostridia bacterium]|nr:alcohol dehydrogenase catalytic domain-containing protein [Clostridia bacterium]
MKGWKLKEEKSLALEELAETTSVDSTVDFSKVKITKALITTADVLRYIGDLDTHEDVVLGSYGIGIISESGSNLFGLEKGKHVYVEPYKPCNECYNCKNGEEKKCSNLMIAGEDYDGFLADFAQVESSKLFLLPDSVSDYEALFIGHISLALSIIDKLGIQKGDYVAVIGANNLGIILSQLLIYYQAVPILISNYQDNIEIAKASGIYYTLGEGDNWQKEVSSLTGGRMAKHVVYFSESNIHANKAFSVASFNADVAFTGDSYKNNPISFSQAIKKQLDIHCINASSGNTAASINLIANKAIDLSHLKLDNAKYDAVPETLENMANKLAEDGLVVETIVDLI